MMENMFLLIVATALLGGLITTIGIVSSPNFMIGQEPETIEYTADSILFGLKNDNKRPLNIYGVDIILYDETYECIINVTQKTVLQNEIVFVTATHSLNISSTSYPSYEIRLLYIMEGSNHIRTKILFSENYWLESD